MDQGELITVFAGSRGWYWRNRSAADVKLTLKTRGAHGEIQWLN